MELKSTFITSWTVLEYWWEQMCIKLSPNETEADATSAKGDAKKKEREWI